MPEHKVIIVEGGIGAGKTELAQPSMNAPNRDRTVGGLGEKVVTKP